MSSGTEELGPTGQPISFFSILKSIAGQLTLGTDITRIALPSIFCYPLSLLEIMAIKRMRGMDQLTEYALTRSLPCRSCYCCCRRARPHTLAPRRSPRCCCATLASSITTGSTTLRTRSCVFSW